MNIKKLHLFFIYCLLQSLDCSHFGTHLKRLSQINLLQDLILSLIFILPVSFDQSLSYKDMNKPALVVKQKQFHKHKDKQVDRNNTHTHTKKKKGGEKFLVLSKRKRRKHRRISYTYYRNPPVFLSQKNLEIWASARPVTLKPFITNPGKNQHWLNSTNAKTSIGSINFINLELKSPNKPYS